MAISYVVLKLSRIFERGAESAPPQRGAGFNSVRVRDDAVTRIHIRPRTVPSVTPDT